MTITITTPELPSIKTLLEVANSYFAPVQRFATERTSGFRSDRFKKFNNPKYIIGAAVIFISLITLFLITKQAEPQALAIDDQLVDAPQPKARQVINKTFEFPLIGPKNEVVSKLKYKVISAELQNAVISKGKLVKTVRGRSFLVINIEIRNNYTSGIEISSDDYVRLFMNNEDKPLSPRFPTEEVKVKAISVEPVRLGFIVNDSDKNIMLKIGEIKGKKETIAINFNNS